MPVPNRVRLQLGQLGHDSQPRVRNFTAPQLKLLQLLKGSQVLNACITHTRPADLQRMELTQLARCAIPASPIGASDNVQAPKILHAGQAD